MHLAQHGAHPTFTTDPYSFSKELIEDIGRYYWRRDGISSVALRFPGVYGEGYIEMANYRNIRLTIHNLLDRLAALDESARQSQLKEVQERALVFRKQRLLEYKEGAVKWPSRSEEDDQLVYL